VAAAPPARAGWRGALARAATWRRGLALGLPVGALQVTVNQGDVWLRGGADAVVVVKTILSPLIAVGIAVASAAWAAGPNPPQPGEP
jgi:hypothetical protein